MVEYKRLTRRGLKIVTWHGEGKTVFYVVSETEHYDRWEVFESFTNLTEAQEFVKTMKAAWN